jgi:hypothetical protein
MSVVSRRAAACLVFSLSLVCAAASLQAATLAEIGDAGDLPATAQAALGQAFGTPLDAITGSIASDSDQDMFQIVVTNPAGFSASTNNAGTELTLDDDTMLYVFDANGFAVAGVDDSATSSKAALPAGSLSGQPMGIYHVAVSLYFTTPVSAGGEMFDLFELFGSEVAVAPNGPGGAQPITGWDLFPDPPQTGPYRIELTGATFVPEPSGPAPEACALLGVVALARATRRRTERARRVRG